MNIKKFFILLFVSLFSINFLFFTSDNLFAAEGDDVKIVYDKTIPEITKIEVVYNNKQGDFFIYGKNFGSDIGNLEVLLIPEYSLENKEIEIKVDKIYPTMITGKILGEYKNGTVVLKKKIGEKEYVNSNKKFFDFKLPILKKVEAPKGFLGGEKILFYGENFRKPVYGLFGSKKIICDKDDDRTCEITIPKDDNLSGDIGISTYGFETKTGNDIAIDKTVLVKVGSYSNNFIIFDVSGADFKDLRRLPKTKDELDAKELDLNKDIKVYVDGQDLLNCTVNVLNKIKCKIDKDIYKKGIGYIDFFGIKSPFFSYDLSDIMPTPKDITYFIKWSTYQDSGFNIIEGNRIHIVIPITNFVNYSKSVKDVLDQPLRQDLKVFMGGSEYKFTSRDSYISKNKIELMLDTFPSEFKGDIYLKFGNVISDSIPYDFGDYKPELYNVYKGEKENEFVVEGKNLTNFNDLEASIKFGDITLSTGDIKKIMSEKEKEAESEVNKYKEFKTREESSEFPDNDKIEGYRIQILKYEGVLRDLEKGIYERSYKDDSKKEGEITRKSNSKIEFKIFDKNEYGKSIGKGEYPVSVTSNGITTDILNFFYDPDSSRNLTKAYPKIEKINFKNGAGDPSKIEIKGKFLEQIKELYFTDLKVDILKKDENNMLIKIDPETVLRKKGTIIAKLDNLAMTSNLFFYDFIDDKSNNITLNWKKVEKNLDDDGNEIPVEIDKEKQVFNLLLKNTYKNLIFKNLKLKIENLQKEKLPFYNFYLNLGSLKVKGIYDEKKSVINFENTDFSKNIPVNEKDFYNLNITFDKINFGKGEVEVKVLDLNFYDDFDFPNEVSYKKISFTKTPKFYKVEDDFSSFCRELGVDGKYVQCGTQVWIKNKLNDSFSEEVVKSNITSRKRDENKKMRFVDIDKNQWFYGYVENLYQRGIINGSGEDGSVFKPLNPINRAEAVKILLLARNEDLTNLDYKVYAFQDVEEGHWAKNILEFAVRNKYLSPVKNFHSDKEISRGEAVKLITKFFGRTVPKYSKYSLVDLGEHWSSDSAEYLYENGIISGVGETREFQPNNKVTRSEFSKMVSIAIDVWSK